MNNRKFTEIDSALQQYFRASRRVRINGRKGAFVVVDDKEEAVNLVKSMFISRGESQVVLGADSVSEAKDVIQKNQIRAVIIDLNLNGEGSDGDGFNLADWLNEEYPDIPFVFATAGKGRVREIERKFPGVDIFIKGLHNIEDFACALGMEEDSNETKVIPIDENSKTEAKSSFSFLKKVLSFTF